MDYIPKIGLGTWLAEYNVENLSKLTNVLHSGLVLGIQLIDTSMDYRTETAIFKAIELSEVNRRDICIITKINFDVNSLADIQQYINLLITNIGYIDVLLLEYPPSNFQDFITCWTRMSLFEGVRHLGFSNFYAQHLLLAYDIINTYDLPRPVINQIEMHALCQEISLIEFHKTYNLPIMSHTSRGGIKSDELASNIVVLNLSKHLRTNPITLQLAMLMRRGVHVLTKTLVQSKLDPILGALDLQFYITHELLEEYAMCDKNECLLISSQINKDKHIQ